MLRYISFLCFVLLINASSASAQLLEPENLNQFSANQLKKLGTAAMEIGDWYSAVGYWKKYTEKKPKDFVGFNELGHAHRAARNFKAAEATFQKAYELNKEKNKPAQFYWGLMQKMNGDCASALDNFSKFRRGYSSKVYADAKKYYGQIRVETEGCSLLDSAAVNVEIIHLNNSINQTNIEFSPMLLDDETLVYGALKNTQDQYYGKDDKKPVRKFYKAKKIGEEWKGVGEWEAPFNFEDAGTGSGAYSPDGSRFYFNKCTYVEHQKICHLYVSRLEGKLWSDPEKLPEAVNQEGFSSVQPTVAIETFKNQEIIYFVSNRPGSKGGTDIWYSMWKGEGKGWFEARNCGFRINSTSDEYGPNYDLGSGKLYYSSAGKIGLGGLDIYSAIGEKGKWENPVNVGHPINSSYDDLFYILTEDGKSGFFTSNRSESLTSSHPNCCDDVYAFIPGPPPPPPEKEDTVETVVVPTTRNLEGRIVQELENGSLTNSSVTGTLVKINRVKDDGSLEFVRQFYTKEDGRFNLDVDIGGDYQISVQKSGYFNKNINISIDDETSEAIKKDIGLELIPDRAIVIKNIYYEFDKSNLTPEAETTLDTTLVNLLAENPSLIIEISSHTDSKGADSYNERLSQNRAESVVRHLTKRGVAPNRLRAKGYGESQPIANNKNEDGSDNPEGRALNRRTEFKVVGQLDADIEYKQ